MYAYVESSPRPSTVACSGVKVLLVVWLRSWSNLKIEIQSMCHPQAFRGAGDNSCRLRWSSQGIVSLNAEACIMLELLERGTIRLLNQYCRILRDIVEHVECSSMRRHFGIHFWLQLSSSSYIHTLVCIQSLDILSSKSDGPVSLQSAPQLWRFNFLLDSKAKGIWRGSSKA